MDKFFYLIWVLIFLLIWLFLFFRRKDTRREMFLVSLLFGVGGVACEKTNIQDWWQPLTITGTRIGIEDFLIGFAIGGIAAVIYEEIYHKRLREKQEKSVAPSDPGFHLLIFPLLYLTLFFLLEVGSFYSAVIAYGLCLGYILLTRKDLIKDSFLSGIWMLFIGISIYFILFQIYPNFIKQFWYLRENWYSKLLWGIPIGEYIFYFFTGAYIGPLYEFLKKRRLVAMR